MELVYVESVYGGFFRIDLEKYRAGKVLLRLFNHKGHKTDSDRGAVVMLHRENIKRFCKEAI